MQQSTPTNRKLIKGRQSSGGRPFSEVFDELPTFFRSQYCSIGTSRIASFPLPCKGNA
ncbi:MAG: hypothetical protein LBK82_02770 [Planctomycetaceae bacterium]|nr:hypothetical protein [Planctomycetaceae bacterium]